MGAGGSEQHMKDTPNVCMLQYVFRSDGCHCTTLYDIVLGGGVWGLGAGEGSGSQAPDLGEAIGRLGHLCQCWSGDW